MELSAELDREKNIFIVHVRGRYQRPRDGFEAQRFVIDSFAEHGCRRILLDLTKAEIKSGVISTYNTANPSPDVATELRKFSFAAVYPEITDDDRFFETVAVNRGLRVRAFDNADSAIEWLEQE
jgi:uncharacterized Fe-S cluster-containing protein